jgi:uncharacterized membrane protein YoaK (UPF0700 family)
VNALPGNPKAEAKRTIVTPRDPLPLLLLVLTAITGVVDAITVLGLGRVFTANMTGNVVFWGFALAGTPQYSVARCATALAAFLVGAACGGRLATVLSGETHRRWLRVVAVVESGLFFAAALLAIGYNLNSLTPTWKLYTLIVLTGTAMGLQNATVRRLGVADLTTTVLTLTLTGLAADSSLAGGENPRWMRRVASVVSLFGGAALGAALVLATGLAVPLALCGVCVLLATFLYAAHPPSGTETD